MKLELNGFQYADLFEPEGLLRLDQAFIHYLSKIKPELVQSLKHYRFHPVDRTHQTSLILELAPHLEDFLAALFNIQLELAEAKAELLSQDPIFAFKKHFVLKLAKHANLDEIPEFESLNRWLVETMHESSHDKELAVAHFATHLMGNPEEFSDSIGKLTQWCIAALHTKEGQAAVKNWVSFKLPKKLDFQHLVNVEVSMEKGVERLQAPEAHFRERDGFDLTDKRMNERQVLNEIHYCVYCHKNQGDFCSTGFPVKRAEPELGLKVNPLGETLTGCPLDEKISEMNTLKKQGLGLAALATIMIDNPMCPATGHRICNDCMKACIYQKQEPVNIPEIETRILVDVLELPWGVEIYDLLTRWNPLRAEQWILKPYNGHKVLVMGMGPAGFSLAHHLLMEGCAVVGADGLKIESLPEELVNEPVYRYEDLEERLSERVMNGFGGVAEYGITVRWDKNFLKLIYLSLVRKKKFQVVGSVRFGGTLTVEDAWRYGFDHLAVAVGAGLPRELKIENSLAIGMRQANDFLMALQLTGAAKASSLANLQMRLPAVVIGGGLTGIDTATEAQAYYIVQVEKIAKRYGALIKRQGEAAIRAQFDAKNLLILDEFLMHAEALTLEREKANQEGRSPSFISLIRQWGGVTVVYRRRMQDSPAYRRNHEEVAKALEEGIYYAEGLEPKAVKLDEFGQVLALECQLQFMNEEGAWVHTDKHQVLPARAIFVATGASPNIAYEFEHRGTFLRQGYEYNSYTDVEGVLEQMSNKAPLKSHKVGAFTSYQHEDHRVSFLGDTHPVFHGSVVKAIASAKILYPQILKVLGVKSASNESYQNFRSKINELFNNYVVSLKDHNPKVMELILHAPLAARHFKAGQFYRLQNYEREALWIDDTSLQMEALAAMAAPVPGHPDQLSFMILKRGVSSSLVQYFKTNEPVALMGPTGVRTKTEEGEKLLVIGGSMAAIYIRSMTQEWKSAGAEVTYLATFKRPEDVFSREELEAACSQVIWLSQEEVSLETKLNQAFKTAVAAPLMDALSHIWVIGSTELLRTVQALRKNIAFNPTTLFKASVYGPMQCMLKGVCAQCLQWQIDPLTGKRTKAVYTCSWHNQPLEIIDIDNLDERLKQNEMQEKLSSLWLDYLNQP